MTRIRIEKRRKSSKRASYPVSLEDISPASGRSSGLLESVEDLLEEIDRALQDAGQH
jgi:hypothetical protein